jgi:uncharacterized membrane protein (UPF0127 family)
VTDWRLETTDGRCVVEQLEIAASFWTRLCGLQFRRHLPVGRALLIAPCPSIHTCCVRFPLDAAFLDRQGRVVEFRRNVRPWRVAVPRAPAYAVLEAESGWLTLEVGESVRISGGNAAHLPRAVRPLQ